MTMIAKIWPSPLPCMRAKAISARFAALSISSRQSRITSGLRRVEHAGGADREDQRGDGEVPADVHYQPPSVGAARPPALAAAARRVAACAADALGHRARAPARARASIDAERGPRRRRRRSPPRRRASTTAPTAAMSSRNDATSNGSRKFVSSSSPICAGRAEAGVVLRAVACRSPSGPEPSIAMHSSTNSTAREERPTAPRSPRPARAAAAARRCAADVGDDEDVEHHHRARVDDDLRGGDELARAAAGTARRATAGGTTSASTL